MITVRRAVPGDLPRINALLYQVAGVHHEGRPDLFKGGAKKYTDPELLDILADPMRPIFAAVDENDTMQVYAFCVFEIHENENVQTDRKTLYIDDICVDETVRGQHIGTAIYNAVLDFARDQDCYNVTLNVWECNPGAMKFYRSLGMVPYKTGMETIL